MRWLLSNVAGGIIRWVVATIISAVCLMLGFAPAEWLAHVIGEPPWWLVDPLFRVSIVVAGTIAVITIILYRRDKEKTPLARPAAPAAKKPAKKAAQQQANPWLTLLLLPLLALVWATERWLSHPEHPATIVHFNKVGFFPPHVEGSPIMLNYYYRNKGPKHAFNVQKSARLFIQSGPFSAKEEVIATEERIFSDFLSLLSRANQRHDGEGRAMAVDEGGWDTLGPKPLDAIDVASLKAGKSRPYFIGIITYSDEHGDWEFRDCRWYGHEPSHSFAHYCMSNNGVKRPSGW